MIKNGSWSIAFFNPGMRPEVENIFGCATLGAIDAAGVHEPDERGTFFTWKESVQADVVYGSRDDCIAELKKLNYTPETALIFLSVGLGAEAFLDKFHELFPETAIAGGVSASLPGERGELLPGNGEAAILLLRNSKYMPYAENILNDTGRRFELKTGENPRLIESIFTGESNFQKALLVWRELQREFCVPADNFEFMTLSDERSVNIHMHAEGGALCSGANCKDGATYTLRFSGHSEIDEGAQQFCAKEDALICGCAGLKSAMRRLPSVGKNSLANFLFGEIAKGQFGNLMMTGLFKKSVDT